MSWSVVNVEEIDGEGPGGAVRFVRRQLGVQAFGINWYELAPNVRGREHDEVDTGQEEVNVIIAGSGVYEIDGESVPVRAGSFLRRGGVIGDTREIRAGPEIREYSSRGLDLEATAVLIAPLLTDTRQQDASLRLVVRHLQLTPGGTRVLQRR